MTEVTRHDAGSLCWAELATTDPHAAKSFYTTLFGWTFADSPMGPGPEDIYTRLQLAGKDVGALYRMMKEQEGQGVPPNWLAYVAVASADEAAKKAKALGGRVLAEPFNVQEYGRMAMLQDPAGATLAVWQAGTHTGAQRINEPGSLCWMELATSDPAGAKTFYSGLFGWGWKDSTDPGMPYTELQVSGRSSGGMLPIRPDMGATPPHWGIYWLVSDCNATAAKAKALGGTLCFGPQDMPKVGRFAVVQDPQGATFSIFQPA